MGNGYSGSSNGVFVQLENAYIRPGEIIRGTVHVNIVVPTLSNGVFLKFSGKEAWKWTETIHETVYESVYVNGSYVNGKYEHGRYENRPRQITRHIDHYGGCIIMNISQGIMPGGFLNPGQYSIPFSMMLPENIPGSFNASGRDHSCRVSYTVKAFVGIPHLLKPNLKHKQVLTVIQSVPQNISRIVATDCSNVNTWCCINNGSMQIDFNCSQDSFAPGETAIVEAKINNNSTVEIPKLSLKIGYTLQFYSNAGSRVFGTGGWLNKAVFPGISANVMNAIRQLSLNIPTGTQQQCLGYTVRMKYFIQLAAKVPCGTDVCCTVPLSIYAEKTEPIPMPQYENLVWQPTMYTAVALDVPPPSAPPPVVSLAEYPDSANMHPSAPPVPVS